MLRFSLVNGKQTIEELCEHCGEKIKDVHISEITVKNPNANWKSLKIRDAEGKDIDVRSKEDFISEKTASYIKEGLLDDQEAIEFRTTKKLKYGVRPEAMCSQSIDAVSKVTASFCYKTTSTTFKARTSGSKTFDQIFNDTKEKKSTELGRKVGIDRKGNIIRMKSEKNLDEPDSKLKYHGQFKESWFRTLKSDIQKSYLEKVQDCKSMIKEFGADACESGEVMSNFKTLDSFKKYMEKTCK